MELEEPEEHTKGEKRWAEKLFHHDDDVQQTVAKKNKFNVWCSTGEEGLHDEGLTGSDEWSVRSARAAAYMEACQDSAEWGEEEVKNVAARRCSNLLSADMECLRSPFSMS